MPEKILMEDKDEGIKGLIKIIDFTNSQFIDRPDSAVFVAKNGLHQYVAPECYGDIVTKATDLWGCGILLYHLLSGSRPYTIKKIQAIHQI